MQIINETPISQNCERKVFETGFAGLPIPMPISAFPKQSVKRVKLLVPASGTSYETHILAILETILKNMKMVFENLFENFANMCLRILPHSAMQLQKKIGKK
jgi:hypothetical protein